MKNTFLFCLSALFSLSALAAPLSPEQALSRAGRNGAMKAASKKGSDAKLVYTSVSEKGVNTAYLFNYTSGGYAVLSADDVAYPVLGYSDKGTLDPNNLSPELKWWLEEYGRQIEWANSMKYAAAQTRAANDWAPILPLVETKWDQDAPYNDMCPIPKTVNGKPYTEGEHTFTGCVATSMAQLMKYFNYPAAGTGTIQYTPTRQGYTFDRMTWNLAKHPFEWDKMLNIYSKGSYTQEQGDAVANLMKCCGVSVEMSYGLDASGASGMSIAAALRNYFTYSDNCRSEFRDIYSSDAWERMIYDNLKEIGPVIMNGQSPSDGGHSFICDGYDGNGYFHFNWGWSGMSDGYYLLQVLNPDAQGIGGYAGGFNFSQNAILGAKPKVAGETGYNNPVRIYQYGAATATISGKTLSFGVRDYYMLGWGNASDRTMNVKIGAIIERKDDTATSQSVQGVLIAGSGKITTFTLSPYGYYPADKNHPEILLPTLSDGEYKVYLACYDDDCNVKEWVPVASPWGYPNYVNLTVAGGKYTVTEVPIAKLVVNNAQITTDLYYKRNFKIKASITNSSDMELTGYYSPALYQGQIRKFYGESVGITVPAGETIDFEWVSKLSAEPGVSTPTSAAEYTFGLYDPGLYAKKEVYGYYGNVTLNPTPTANPRLSISDFTIKGEETTIMFNDRETSTIAVSDPNNVEVTFSYKDIAGYFDGMMKLALAYSVSGENITYPVIDEIATSQPFLTSGMSDSMNVHFAIPHYNYKEGVLYQVVASYTLNSRWTNFASKGFIVGTSGIDEVGTETGEKEYFNLQGCKLDGPIRGEVIIEKCNGKYKKVLFK